MNTADLRAKSVSELQEELVSLKKQQFKLRFNRSVEQGEVSKPHMFRAIRRMIARIKTLLNEKSAEAQS